MTARSLRIERETKCDDFLTAEDISCRVDPDGTLRVWSVGGFRMARYEAGDWIAIHAVPAPTSTYGDSA